MFESTLPADAAELMRVSDFRRYLRADTGPEAVATRLSSLNPSLLQDLQRFEHNGAGVLGIDVLDVLAAAVRHARALLLHLESDARVVPLTVFPAPRLVFCPLPLPSLLAARLDDLKVLHVEPARLCPPGHAETLRVGEERLYGPLGPVLWELALRGSREALLPEIAGNAAYRLAPGADLRALDLTGSLGAAVARLKREATNLRELSGWPGFDLPRAQRLLNGLYLQHGLIVSRTHPAATNEGWFSGKA